MAGRHFLAFLGCALACGCAEPTAPKLATSTGQWQNVFSMAGQMGTAWAQCSGVLGLTLTQTDSTVTGNYALPASPDEFSCRVSANGAMWGFLGLREVAGTASASGGRLAGQLTLEFFPDTLVFVGAGNAERLSGVVSSTFPARDSSGTLVSVTMTGAFELVRAP